LPKNKTAVVQFSACSKCGSADLVWPLATSVSTETFLIPGINELRGVKECVKCGHVGFPVLKQKRIKLNKKAKKNNSGRLAFVKNALDKLFAR